MDEKQASYFEALTAEALKSAEALESFRLRGVRESMVDKYSDQAHFIYELLQNADDANATSAHFELFKEELVFSHNGTRRFSVSNPATETEDQKSGMLGDINAITAVGSSSKPDEAAIGKFGLGFKAVFQYTTTPHIYDPDVFFKIERFIVPIRLNNDYPWRRRDETLFVFPFNHPARSAEDSYADISDKLRSLEYPLLFLSNLKEITFKIAGIMGSYRKSVEKRLNFADTSAELIKLVQNNDETDLTLRVDLLWLFTRHDKSGSKYCVGFFVDAGRLAPKKHRAFCFFPTKEVTGLNFIIHAPFLLTDSREGIKAGVKHNIEMIALLAQLAADCLLYLIDDDLCEKPMIDDGIFDIIPFDEQEFADLKSVNHISFKPFYNAIKKSFETHAVIPALGGYARMEDAYWTTPQIAKLFSNAQLALLSGNENARWVFTSFEPKAGLQRRGRILTEYINSITTQRVQDSDIIAGHPGFPGISAPFIESQPPLWLHAFYAWIGESKARIDLSLKRPILIDQHGKAKSVLDEKNHFSLFLPTDVTETGTGFDTVRKDFLDSDATLHFIKKQLGLAEPSLIDEINLIILRQYTEGIYLDIKQHFKKFFSYYEKSTRSEANRFVEEIREHGFILGHWAGDAQLYRGNAGELYFPSDLLLQWFMAKPAKFVSLEFYIALVGDDKKEDVSAFLKDLGVADTPRVLPRPLAPEEALLIQPYWPESTGGQPVWTENALDGCRELVHATALERSSALSKLVWNQLLALIVSGCFKDARNFLLGQYDYFVRGKPKSQPFESMDAKVLRSEPWLQNINGDFLPADRLTVLDLNPGYDTSSIAALELIRALGIKEKAEAPPPSDPDIIKLGKALALTDEEQLEAFRLFATKKTKPRIIEKEPLPIPVVPNTIYNQSGGTKEFLKPGTVDIFEGEVSADSPLVEPSVRQVAKELSKMASVTSKDRPQLFNHDELFADEDDFQKPTLALSEKIEKVKEQASYEVQEIAILEVLKKQAQDSKKYSYGWFKTLLELESINHATKGSELSISFSYIDIEPPRTLILLYPSTPLPLSIQEIADIPLELHFKNQPTQKLSVEVISRNRSNLRVRLKSDAPLKGLDLSQVTDATIIAKNPVFLIDELRHSFFKLGEENFFDDTFDLQQNLCENIEFILGPPGTGKTTSTASAITGMMRAKEDINVLVLTPTNKAADVMAKKILECTGDLSYRSWLVRFGATNDPLLEETGVYHERAFDIRTFKRSVIVTTIQRFSYDCFFLDEGARLPARPPTRLLLKDMKWDYIIFDEAQMIPAAYIVYALYKKKPWKFVITGDPFQIGPITTVDEWKDENIFTMTELTSFQNLVPVPNPYPVEILTTQFRSVPQVGEIYSRFAYNGILDHHRPPDNLRIADVLGLKPLTIIKFPVTKYESIYRPKRLSNKTPYHIYSALFAMEYVKHLSSFFKLAKRSFSIGLIAPYKAQADLLDRLMAKISWPKNISFQVGTIHSFQGDEADIIIAMFNPPPYITSNKDTFLNQLNIVNLTISRARDYLIILMPDDSTENVANLTLIKKLEKIIKDQPLWTEHLSPNIEELLFESKTFIEDNSFSTAHQLVNVYRKPEMRYEVRSESSAIDVQLHDE